MKRFAKASTAAVLALGASTFAVAPAEAAAPLFTGGLVNVTVTDVANNNEIEILEEVAVGVAAGIAANVCDTTVGGILGQLRDTGSATCTSRSGDQTVDITQ